MIRINESIAIADGDIEERFTRAMGTGGQNPRHKKTAVQLRYDVARSSLPPDMKMRLIGLAGRHLNADGVLVIDSRAHESQGENRADAHQRLLALLKRAARVPATRRQTRPRRVEKVARLTAKRLRGAVKQGRARPLE